MVSEVLAEKGGKGQKTCVSPAGHLLTQVTNFSWFAQDIPGSNTKSPASWKTGTVGHPKANPCCSVLFEKDLENCVCPDYLYLHYLPIGGLLPPGDGCS